MALVQEVVDWAIVNTDNIKPNPPSPTGRTPERNNLTFQQVMGSIARWRDKIDADIAASGGIGGSIADNQIAVGAATADEIEGSDSFTWDGGTNTATIGDGTAGGSLQIDAVATENPFVGFYEAGVLSAFVQNSVQANDSFRMVSITDKLEFYPANTLALTLDTSQNATFAGDVVLSTTLSTIRTDDNASSWYISGGDSQITGLNMRMGGQTGTFAYDFEMRQDTTRVMKWDNTSGSWDFYTGFPTPSPAINISSAGLVQNLKNTGSPGFGMVEGVGAYYTDQGNNSYIWGSAPDEISIVVGNQKLLTLGTSGVPADQEILIWNTTNDRAEWGVAPGAGATIGGSIADNQIAVGAATADTIEGSSALTFDANTFALASPATTQDAMTITANSLTTGRGLVVTSTGVNRDTNPLVEFIGAAGQTGSILELDGQGLGAGLVVTKTGAGEGIIVNHSGTGRALSIIGGESVFPGGTTNYPSIIIEEGVAPTSPVDGAVWITAAGAFNARLNGVTVDLASGIGGSIANNQVAVGAATADTIEGDANLTWDGSKLAVLGEIEIDSYSEDADSYTVTVGTKTLDTSAATYFYASAAMTAVALTFAFSNPAATGRVTSIMVEMNNAAGLTGGGPTWPLSVDWAGGTEPTWTAGIDVAAFWTRDGGTTWHGSAATLDSK